ncbi:copper amine oxidase N-terminal domain-containing protein [Alkaliphilus transvaalensis]|uniref:copper amine oxidase N-terminal domain-containing protein n=1 Tax=Alkaliphilus transvaalensis TaxID=114628 RepID=UPI00047D13ED|nr:copper amine oxidase N-terminal domain-containing protein [Alkaliphilus transvaalensis]
MKKNKITAGLLSASILALSAGTTFASEVELLPPDQLHVIYEAVPISAPLHQSHFNGVRGEVKEIKELSHLEDTLFATIQVSEDQIVHMYIPKNLHVIGSDKIEVGAIITGYYDVNKPMLMIYPPQYNIEAVHVEGAADEMINIKVDLFNEDLVSADHSLKIMPSDETVIITQDGNVYEGELINRHLAVVYGISTKSLPAQTAPTKIIVLTEEEVELENEGVELIDYPDSSELIRDDIAYENHIPIMGDVSKMDYIVENNEIILPSAYIKDESTVMVPLRGIAEELGLDVKWDPATKSITVGSDINLSIGGQYTSNGAIVDLGTAPELLDGTTYVPLSFFRKVAHFNNAYVFEGQIVIDNGEKME